jgi:hypothetical protein
MFPKVESNEQEVCGAKAQILIAQRQRGRLAPYRVKKRSQGKPEAGANEGMKGLIVAIVTWERSERTDPNGKLIFLIEVAVDLLLGLKRIEGLGHAIDAGDVRVEPI